MGRFHQHKTPPLLYFMNRVEEGFCVFRNGLISISDWVFGNVWSCSTLFIMKTPHKSDELKRGSPQIGYLWWCCGPMNDHKIVFFFFFYKMDLIHWRAVLVVIICSSIYNYLCSWCRSPLKLRVRIPLMAKCTSCNFI